MGQDRNVIQFRKLRGVSAAPLRRRFRRRRGPRAWMIGLLVLSLGGLGAITFVEQGNGVSLGFNAASYVNWVDGDSGTLNGREFRLYGVDAPEGSPSRAQCQHERNLAPQARTAAQHATQGRSVVVTQRFGKDRYGRELVRLSADGRDVASGLVASGHLEWWNFEAGQGKPDWCR